MNNDRTPPKEQFVANVKQLLRDIEDFKSFARSGQDSIRMYRVFSSNASDKSMTNVRFNNTRFRLIFTPDDGAARGLVYKMEYTYTEGSGNSVQIDLERENVNNVDGSQSWVISVSGSDFFPNSLVTMKFYFWSSGTGTFSTVNL